MNFESKQLKHYEIQHLYIQRVYLHDRQITIPEQTNYIDNN